MTSTTAKTFAKSAFNAFSSSINNASNILSGKAKKEHINNVLGQYNEDELRKIISTSNNTYEANPNERKKVCELGEKLQIKGFKILNISGVGQGIILGKVRDAIATYLSKKQEKNPSNPSPSSIHSDNKNEKSDLVVVQEKGSSFGRDPIISFSLGNKPTDTVFQPKDGNGLIVCLKRLKNVNLDTLVYVNGSKTPHYVSEVLMLNNALMRARIEDFEVPKNFKFTIKKSKEHLVRCDFVYVAQTKNELLSILVGLTTTCKEIENFTITIGDDIKEIKFKDHLFLPIALKIAKRKVAQEAKNKESKK